MKILFLGRNDFKTEDIFCSMKVDRTEDPIEKIKEYDLVLSYRYRHKIPKEQLDIARLSINVHTSFLPYCRGADPHFWCVWDRVLGGATIHQLDEDIDTGPIYMRLGYDPMAYLDISLHEWWSLLDSTAIRMAKEFMVYILSGHITWPVGQEDFGSRHYVKDRALVQDLFDRDPKELKLKEIVARSISYHKEIDLG